MLWLIAANPNKYDIEMAFNELKFIDWTKNANYKKNDIIFIYISNPVQRIKYICKVINDNINEEEAIDDKKYWLNSSDFSISSNGLVRLELIKKIQFDISFYDLRTHGFNGSL
ncbi:MAG: EVE domain-containing protein [Bacillota bacterium]|nr:EVE domain-containing protein [Bacillota bacterium]